MTPPNSPAREERKGSAASNDKASPQAIEFKPPLRPHRGLLAGLAIAFVLWLGFLIWLFVTTVYPHPETDIHRHPPAPATAPTTVTPAGS